MNRTLTSFTQPGLAAHNVLLAFILGAFIFLLPASAQTADNPATLVIVDSRGPNLWDYGIKFFDETGKQVATMKKCQIVRVSMTPGPHTFRTNKDKKKLVSIQAVAGEKYFARAGITNLRLFPASMQFDFDLITREQAESWASKCKLAASSLDAESPSADDQR